MWLVLHVDVQAGPTGFSLHETRLGRQGPRLRELLVQVYANICVRVRVCVCVRACAGSRGLPKAHVRRELHVVYFGAKGF